MTKYPSFIKSRCRQSRISTLSKAPLDERVETRSGVFAQIELSNISEVLGSLDVEQWLADRNKRVLQRLREIWEYGS